MSRSLLLFSNASQNPIAGYGLDILTGGGILRRKIGDLKMHTHIAEWIDLISGTFNYVLDVDQNRFFSDDGAEWVDKNGKLAMTIGFKNASILLIGGPKNGEVVK
jgi:hypothetical protein